MSNARPADPFNLCQFTFANGRMCGLPAHPKHDGLCLSHARAATFKQEKREEDLSAEIRSFSGDYITQIDINHVLGRLFDALASNRISVKRATSLAYIADLMMRSQIGAKDEARRWAIDLPTYRSLLTLKYPKGHANHPDSWIPKNVPQVNEEADDLETDEPSTNETEPSTICPEPVSIAAAGN